MDNLEKYLRSHRDALDVKEPRDKVWNRIETELDETPGHKMWLWKAAVIVLIAVCAFLVWERNYWRDHSAAVAVSEINLDPEFEETELYYTQLIQEKQQLITHYRQQNPDLVESFQADLDNLDSLYLELKTEFIETSNQTVVEAMINNLQLRMELLNQQIKILEKIDNNHHEETTTII